MTGTTKKRNIIMAFVLTIIALIGALFSVFMPKSERLEASAAATYENENLKFAHNGAYGSMYAYDMYHVIYYLTVNRAIFDEEDGDLWITFYDFYQQGNVELFYNACEWSIEGAKDTYGAYFGNSDTEDQVWDSVITLRDKELSADPFVMHYTEEDLFSSDSETSTRITIDVRADLTRPVQVVACMGTGEGLIVGENTAHAISDQRKLSDMMSSAYDANDPAVVDNPYFSDVVEFSREDTTAFDISVSANLSARDGLVVMVNLPTNLQEQLTADETDTWHTYDSWLYNTVTYKKSYLVLTRAETKTDFTNANTELLLGNEYVHYYYDLGGASKEAARPDAQEFNMWGGTLKEFRLPIPEDTEKTYYYYAQVISYNVYGYKWMFGGFEAKNYSRVRQSRTESVCEVNVKTLAKEILESDRFGSNHESAWLQSISGLTPSTETVELQVSYLRLKEGARTAERDVFSIEIPSVNVFNAKVVWSTLTNTPIPQDDGMSKYYTSLSQFNVVVESREMYNGEWYSTGFRILRQAKGYSYEYNELSEIARLTIEYAPFEYSSFAIRVQSNETGSGLYFDYYTANVEENNGKTTMTFNYEDMETHLSNFFINAGDVDWVNSVDKDCFSVIENKGSNYTYAFTADALTITFPTDGHDLDKLYIMLYAPIEDGTTIYKTSYTYKQLSVDETGTIATKNVVVDMGDLPLSELIRVLSTWDNFYVDNENIGNVKSAIDGGTLSDKIYTIDGEQGYYYIPSGITRNRNKQNLTCDFTVLYEKNALFEIRDNIVGYRKHVQALGGTTLYSADRLLSADEIPEGYRVESVAATGATVRTGEDPDDYTQTTLTKNINGVMAVTYTLTNKWKLTINRMETYVNLAGVTTPFCTKKTDTVELSYSDYPDLTALTATDVAHILGYQALEDLRVCKIGLPYNDIEVTFNGSSTYTTTLEYGNSTLVALDTNGNTKTIEVPLTSFTDWADAFWEYDTTPNVLMLNTKKNTWFQTGEIRSQKIYGYFATAVFELQKSNLQDAFYNRKGDGCVTFFDKREVVGSDLYKFFEEQSHNGVLNGALASLGMIFCELWNDDNVTLESNFFYLDGTNTTDPYLTIGGADSSDDKDTALENAGQDVVDNIQNWWVSLNQETGIETILKAALAVVGIVGLAAVCFWLLNKAGVFKTAAELSSRRTPAPKKRVATSQPKKGTKKDEK